MKYLRRNLLLCLLFMCLLFSPFISVDADADMIIDNGDPNPWDPADSSATSLWSSNGGTYTWHADLLQSGIYDVYMWCTYYASRSTNAPVTIQYDGGSITIPVNQQENASTWYLLGSYNFSADTGGTVTITAEDAYPTSYCADAVKFVYVPDVEP